MKIRTITLGIQLSSTDLLNNNGSIPLVAKLEAAKEDIDAINARLQADTSHEVQTCRISTNPFEDWLVPLLRSPYNLLLEDIMELLDSALKSAGIQMCSIGPCSSLEAISLIPRILSLCATVSCSVLFQKSSVDHVSPEYSQCFTAAQACLEVARLCGDLGNFRFCASFNCKPGIPFFPAAYCHSNSTQGTTLSIGLENGDLLFLAFHGAGIPCEDSSSSPVAPHTRGSAQLRDLMRQICLPIQRSAMSICQERGIDYAGIDASINPGLTLPDSIGAGLESLLLASIAPTLGEGMEHAQYRQFGCMGTLGAVSAVTRAIKSLGTTLQEGEEVVQLTGYSGLMLPVMEDLILAQRAAEGRFSLRDLLTFSAVCGVGIDTVPVPGDTPVATLAGIYMETAALAFRLDKPLSCRVLPQRGKVAGEQTDVVSPYLCNTTVFAV